MDTCPSDVYNPSISDLDPDSLSIHSRVTDRLKVEQADRTKLVSSGVGKLAGAPAYVMPDMSDTLLGANVICDGGALVVSHPGGCLVTGGRVETRPRRLGQDRGLERVLCHFVHREVWREVGAV